MDHLTRMSTAALQLKKSLAHAIRQRMATEHMSITTFARKTRTGRNSVRRILDSKNTAITLKTMAKAAEALNLELTLTVKKLSPAKLGKIADQYALAIDKQEVAQLETQFLEGFYGQASGQVYAKNPAV